MISTLTLQIGQDIRRSRGEYEKIVYKGMYVYDNAGVFDLHSLTARNPLNLFILEKGTGQDGVPESGSAITEQKPI